MSSTTPKLQTRLPLHEFRPYKQFPFRTNIPKCRKHMPIKQTDDQPDSETLYFLSPASYFLYPHGPGVKWFEIPLAHPSPFPRDRYLLASKPAVFG